MGVAKVEEKFIYLLLLFFNVSLKNDIVAGVIVVVGLVVAEEREEIKEEKEDKERKKKKEKEKITVRVNAVYWVS